MVKVIKDSAHIQLSITEDGFQNIEVQAMKEMQVDIHVDKRINASLFITYTGTDAEIKTRIIMEDDSNAHIMFKNDLQNKCEIVQEVSVYRNASLNLAYCELSDSETKLSASLDLLKEGASIFVRSACIANADKVFHLTCTHHVPYTTGIMENYAVVEEKGNYRMEACGKIVKGAKESASHQKTRVLTMSEKHTSEVTPLLLIDENDVKASHATTLGQPDANQLYYLQTRGLSRKQALGLLTVGYIMPITEMIQDEVLQEALKNEIEMKVGLHA